MARTSAANRRGKASNRAIIQLRGMEQVCAQYRKATTTAERQHRADELRRGLAAVTELVNVMEAAAGPPES